MKRLYGDRIALVGNVNNKVTLVTGSAADVEAEVKECIAAAAWGGLCALLRSASMTTSPTQCVGHVRGRRKVRGVR